MRGQADFGMYAPKEIGASLADMADLAVRLGSIVEFDRRGDIIYLDDYEAPIQKYIESASGVGTVKLDSEAAVSGGQSLKFTTHAVAPAFCYATYDLAPMVIGQHGAKISASLYDLVARDADFLIRGYLWTGGHHIKWQVTFNPLLRTIAYLGADDEDHVFEDAFYLADYWPSLFHNIKVVVNLDTGKYVRLLVDTLSWDMSAYSFYKVALVEVPFFEVVFGLVANTDFAEETWLDNFVYTINEP